MATGVDFDYIGLELEMAGCPNTCRHCRDEGRPPCGGLMTVADARWVTERFRALPGPPIVAPFPCHELTAHPDFLDRAARWGPSTYPSARVLAERYGDPDSTLIHPFGSSVQLKWIAQWRAEDCPRP